MLSREQSRVKLRRMGDPEARVYECISCGKLMETRKEYDLIKKHTDKPRCPRCTAKSTFFHYKESIEVQ
jgi:DNA-directed RNA polymerase subunit RPC12/RpoP